jgi:GT2 family glycosyltransferase
MDLEPSAPPVVAVVITCDAGPWLEETLLAVGAQDYPNFSVLVIDAHSAEDPTPRIAAVLPHAYVRRLPDRVGFSRAANEVLGTVEGASHYLFCHDDIAPAPNVVRILVEEAFRSNAALVAPKMLVWERPDLLLSVGQSADKTGLPADLVDRGELDQEQYDAVRDVFCAPGGCTLVRADLFHALGGFDEGVDLFGEDLNLSWRAQVAGGRVVVAPDARVAHVEAISSGVRPG